MEAVRGRRLESSAVLRDGGRTDKKARDRDAQIQFGWIAHRHEGGRAVVGVEQRREERVTPAQVEEIHGPFPAERIEGTRRRTLLFDLAVTPADSVELVRGVQAERVRQR